MFGFRLKLLVLALWGATRLNSHAVVDAASPANTNAPTDGSPWASVGTVNGASGTYLAAGWVLTAGHVGVGDFTLDSGLFIHDGTFLALTNADGTLADMLMFHLASLPSLPNMPLVSTTPNPASQVDMIAYGKIAGSTQTNIEGSLGFYWSAAGYKSWGNAKVDGGGLLTTVTAIGSTTTLFSTTFRVPGQFTTSDPAQAAAGDSGGGIFQKSGTNWQLVGMIDAISTQVGQPNKTAVYGNKTYAADMATYQAQIAAIIQGTIPALSISQSDTNVQLCWPDTGVGYNLQTTSTLSPTSWSPATGTTSAVPGQICVLLPATNDASYFRLQKQ